VLLPIDPYAQAFERIRKALRNTESAKRPDIIVFAIRIPSDGSPLQLKITPLEVKFREGTMSATTVREALEQAANMGALFDALWVRAASTELWANCRAALLAQCLDFSFRVYADSSVHGHSHEEWTSLHERVLRSVLGRTADISVTSAGRLLVFDESRSTTTSDMDDDASRDTAIVCRYDAEVLLTGNGELTDAAGEIARTLDFSFLSCAQATPRDSVVSPSPTTPLNNAGGTTAPVMITIPNTTIEYIGEPTNNVPEPSTEHDASGAPSDSHLPIPKPVIATTTPFISQSVAALPSRIPPEIRQQVRDAFDGFIGNASAVKRITNDLLLALIERPPFLAKNYLFTGQPSTGKTEIARRMSGALALPFVKLDGRGVQSRARLFDLINGELTQQGQAPMQTGQMASLPVMQYPALVVFIDEVHLVPRAVQESLLTMLEAADRTVSLEDHVARVNLATFLFATTRASDVDAAFKTRCAEVQLKEYELEEVAEIVRRKTGTIWPDNIYTEIARYGRTIPRIALELAKELETELTVTEYPERSISENLEEVRKAREIDPLGLTPIDHQYLTILERENRAVGEQAILNMLGTVDKDRILNEVEPFLIRLRLLCLGPRGREITNEGKEYVLNRRRGQ
jgi:Holliday junction DNA helicase RuvB